MNMGGIEELLVKVRRNEVVAAVLPMQEYWLPLSNLDLLLPPVDVGVFFCYRKPTDDDSLTFGAMVGVLKTALAQALVSYYPFAGEVLRNTAGEPEILCNNRGVDFIEAFADVDLRDLNFHNPDESIEGKLVPKKKQGVLSIQATELKCGGLVVACVFDHRVADAYSANLFLVSWAETAQSKPLSQPPLFHRSLLYPRRPRSYHPSIDRTYVHIPPSKDPEYLTCTNNDQPIISRIYYIGANQLSRLQSAASARSTKLEAFSAFLWKVIATGTNDKKMCRMGIAVDGRRALCNALFSSYFGNVLSIPFAEKSSEEVREKPLSWVADAIHECIERATKKEHFLGLIDWVEAHRKETTLARIYACKEEEEGPTIVVSSGRRLSMEKVDFGWGRPALGSYHFPWGGEAGYVMPMPSPLENGDWIVYMHLLKEQMDLVEGQAAGVFKPLTCDYLQI